MSDTQSPSLLTPADDAAVVARHTPGPWTIICDDNVVPGQLDSDGYVLDYDRKSADEVVYRAIEELTAPRA